MQKFFILCSLLIICGCSTDARPDDLPPLFPCTITITRDGKPLEEAVVKLVAQADTARKYQPVAVTGANGEVVMSTYGFPGIPAGTYDVSVTKNVEEDFVYTTDDAGEPVLVSSKTYRTVEKRFSDTQTTPHEIEITPESGNVRVTFDVGKTVRERI